MQYDLEEEISILRKKLASAERSNSNLMKLVEENRKAEIITKNQNFIQLYKINLPNLIKLAELDINSVMILFVLLEKMNKQNAVVISQKALTSIIKKSRTTLYNAIKELVEYKFIEVFKVGTANAYVINSEVAWQDGNDKKSKFASFTAQVIAISDEQIDKRKKDVAEKIEKSKIKPKIEKIEKPKVNSIKKQRLTTTKIPIVSVN